MPTSKLQATRHIYDVDTSKTYPNIGKAPPKKDKRTNQNSSKKRSGAPVVPQKSFSQNGATTPTSTFSDTRTCYICQVKGHIATHCPQKQANKQNAKVKLKTKKLEKESAVCRRTALFLVNLDGRQDTKTTQDRKKETKINVPQD